MDSTQLAQIKAAYHVGYKMWDDDYYRLTANPQPQTQVVLDSQSIAANAYKDVYIVLKYADSPGFKNTITNRPFTRSFTIWDFKTSMGKTQNLLSDSDCWCTLVVHGFEPHWSIGLGADFDPDGLANCSVLCGIVIPPDHDTAGITLGNSAFNPIFNQSIVFCETSYEVGQNEGLTMAHEIGHEALGPTHFYNGQHLMAAEPSDQDANPHFLPVHRHQIRSLDKW